VIPRRDGGAELDGLFVDPPAWGRGIGSRLLARAEQAAYTMDAATLWVISGPQTEGFYAKLGFERTAETKTRFGKAATMRKRLPAS
jgi:N-acetylglutamate synthase-like GNAT family acetyltransferase